jgi:hypothetical protein
MDGMGNPSFGGSGLVIVVAEGGYIEGVVFVVWIWEEMRRSEQPLMGVERNC